MGSIDLPTVWFLLIAVLWLGYFVLEGFDFGVGMLLAVLGRRSNQASAEQNKRVLINTIGPLWDGNEVWLITAAGAIFAAFPEWYATLFSGLYLPLFAVLLGLIVRAVAFEYRAKRDSAAWLRGWDWCIMLGSLIPTLIWGIGFANFVHGLPLNADHVIEGSAGNFFALFSPFALLGGVLTVVLFSFHGAVFVSLKTTGEIRENARALAGKLGAGSIVLVAAFTGWQNLTQASSGWQLGAGWTLAAVAVLSLIAAWLFNSRGREGWAFTGTALSILTLFAGIFVAMFPNVLLSSLDPAWSLTITNASSTPYTLKIMTVATLIFLPLVLGYQAWTYWVFRKRISTKNLPVVPGKEGSAGSGSTNSASKGTASKSTASRSTASQSTGPAEGQSPQQQPESAPAGHRPASGDDVS